MPPELDRRGEFPALLIGLANRGGFRLADYEHARSMGFGLILGKPVRLAPRLKPYVQRPSPTWPEIVDAADWLRHDLDVSKPLWGEACLAMGREQAAVALAIVSTKDPGHFRTTAGGYFHGMVMKAKSGQLNLDRTLWAMRRAAEPRPSRKPGGEGNKPPLSRWN